MKKLSALLARHIQVLWYVLTVILPSTTLQDARWLRYLAEWLLAN